jgi:group I intron endonuclease
LIYSALLKYDYKNFKLEILEYSQPDLLIEREQYYFNILKPEYNICKIAGSTYGKQHSIETILKIKKKRFKLSDQTKTKISMKLKGRKVSFLTKQKLKNKARKSLIILTNINDGTKIKYLCLKVAAKNLKVCIKTIYNYANTGKIFRRLYLITKISYIS